MCKIRFSNIFRSVTLDLSEEAVSLIRQGRHPRTVLSEDQASAVTGKLARRSSDWSFIFAYESNGDILWTQPAPPAKYISCKHRINA